MARPRITTARGSPALDPSLWQEGLFPSRPVCTWLHWDTMSLRELASARSMAGPRAWEITRLHLSTPDSKEGLELLEKIAQRAAALGAERLFLRLPVRCEVEELTRRAGFHPVCVERVLKGTTREKDERLAALTCNIRPFVPSDLMPLFQNYCASTPSVVRAALGMTLEQWQDTQYPPVGKAREYVAEEHGRIKAWIRIYPERETKSIQVTCSSDMKDMLPEILRVLLPPSKRLQLIAPDYMPWVEQALSDLGYEHVSEYLALVRPVAVKVESPSLASVHA